MKTTRLPSVEEVVKEVANIQPKNVYTLDWQSMLTQDRNQAYTSLVEGIEGMKTDERKVATFGEWQAESYEDKMLVNAILTNILEKLVKPLYNKTGDN